MNPVPTTTRPPRSWRTFTLRALLFLMLLSSVPLAWFANWKSQKHREQMAARRLHELGGTVVNIDFRYLRKRSVTLNPWLPTECFYFVTEYSSNPLPAPAGFTMFGKGSPVDEEVVSLITQLPNLRNLTLNGPRIDNVSLAPFKDLPQLSSLKLSCDVTDADLLAFRQHQLRDLVLRGPVITDTGMEILHDNCQLTRLELFDTCVTDGSMSRIGKLRNLKWLSLRQTRVTSNGISEIAKLSELEYLDLAETRIDDSAVTPLRKMKALQHLHLWETEVSPEGAEQLRKALPNCSISYP